MSLNQLGLGFVFNAQDLASGVMDKIKGSIKGLEEKSGKSLGNIDGMMKKMGAGAGIAAVGVGGLAGSFALATKAGDFEQALAGVAAVTHATTEEMAQMRTAAMDAARGTSMFSPTKAVEGFNELAQAGYDVGESMKLLKPSLNLAAGSGGLLSVAEAAGTVAQALKGYGIDTSLAGAATDQMAQGANAFAMNAADVPIALGKIARGAFAMKQSMTEAMIAFGLTKNVLGSSEVSANAVSTAMTRMVDKDVMAKLKSIGKVDVIDKQTGQFRNLTDVISDLMPAIEKMGTKGPGWLKEMFGDEGMSAVGAIMSQIQSGQKIDGKMFDPKDVITGYREFFRSASGTNEEFARRSMDTFNGSMLILDNRMQTLAIASGEAFRDQWRPVIDGVNVGLDSLIGSILSIDPATKNTLAAIVMGASAFLAFGGAVIVITAAAPLLGVAFGALAGGLWAMATAAAATLIALWPFLLAGAAIAAIVYAIQNNIGGLGDAWDRVVVGFQGGGAFVMRIFDKISAYVMPLWDSLKAGFEATFATLTPVFTMLGNAFDQVMAAFSSLGSVMDETNTGPGVGMKDTFKLIGSVIAGVVGVIVTLVGWFLKLFAVVINVAAGIASFFKPIVMGVFDAISFWVEKIIWLVDKVASFLGVVGVGSFAASDNVGTSRASDIGSDLGRSLAGAPRRKVPTGPVDTEPAAAVADSQTRSAMMSTGGGAIDYAKLAETLNSRPLQTTVTLDGEKIASAVTKGQRSYMARSSGGDSSED